ncbi:hypothetical protein POM88_007700 [Heracleum sosnowskyi]|uniref:Uncharacterized protein n=1 Tax=Heracleum sosnowskyi TaxID=360622 RepID=A0AAD8J537_9APIA|nr:hypothetical protein POM88_007700 [Heracleum sosnowskyi]
MPLGSVCLFVDHCAEEKVDDVVEEMNFESDGSEPDDHDYEEEQYSDSEESCDEDSIGDDVESHSDEEVEAIRERKRMLKEGMIDPLSEDFVQHEYEMLNSLLPKYAENQDLGCDRVEKIAEEKNYSDSFDAASLETSDSSDHEEFDVNNCCSKPPCLRCRVVDNHKDYTITSTVQSLVVLITTSIDLYNRALYFSPIRVTNRVSTSPLLDFGLDFDLIRLKFLRFDFRVRYFSHYSAGFYDLNFSASLDLKLEMGCYSAYYFGLIFECAKFLPNLHSLVLTNKKYRALYFSPIRVTNRVSTSPLLDFGLDFDLIRLKFLRFDFRVRYFSHYSAGFYDLNFSASLDLKLEEATRRWQIIWTFEISATQITRRRSKS